MTINIAIGFTFFWIVAFVAFIASGFLCMMTPPLPSNTSTGLRIALMLLFVSAFCGVVAGFFR